MWLLALVLAPLAYSVALWAVRRPQLARKRVCLLIAHPDDEAMFFAPTVLGLTRADAGNDVRVLCLSAGSLGSPPLDGMHPFSRAALTDAGNAQGLGETRKRELVKSCAVLGVREDGVTVVDSPDFPDSMTARWDADGIRSVLLAAPPLDVLVTFDARGVSSHPNHVSLYHGALAFARHRHPGSPDVKLYVLDSVNVVRKYAGCLDLFPTLARGAQGRLVFANQLLGGGPRVDTAWVAMTTAHRSQMVWFRYLWLVFSRYMLVNELTLVAVD